MTDALAKKIWDYHHLHHKLEKADAILAFGSYDLRVAEYAAKLFLEGWAPLLIVSGKEGIIAHSKQLTSELWGKREADMFAEVAMRLGVPKENILIENQSMNTSENILFAKKLLEEQEINIKKIILVHKPYTERRAYAAFKKRWPEVNCIVASPPISFEDYPYEGKPKDAVINSIVGELQRIKIYAERGWQIPQKIPADVWDTYEKLVALGYTKNLVK